MHEHGFEITVGEAFVSAQCKLCAWSQLYGKDRPHIAIHAAVERNRHYRERHEHEHC